MVYFQFQNIIDFDDAVITRKVIWPRYKKKYLIIERGIYGIAGLFFLLLAIMFFRSDVLYILMTAICLINSARFFWHMVFIHSGSRKNFEKRMARKQGTQTLNFEEDGIRVIYPEGQEVFHPYSLIRAIYYSNSRCIIYASTDICWCLRGDRLISGNIQKFPGFLTEKTGKEVIHV